MLQFPLGDGGVFALIEPGNVKRLKEGKPLKVGNCLIAFTPDMEAFLNVLGVDLQIPEKGQPATRKGGLRLSPEQIQEALDKCAGYPEVLR